MLCYAVSLCFSVCLYFVVVLRATGGPTEAPNGGSGWDPRGSPRGALLGFPFGPPRERLLARGWRALGAHFWLILELLARSTARRVDFEVITRGSPGVARKTPFPKASKL